MVKSKKTKKSKSKSRAISGRILPPVNITNVNDLGELDTRLSMGPMTLVFVYADWCGHCTNYKPHMDELENMTNRSIQTVRIRDDVFPKSSISKTPLEGYPSLFLLDKSKEPITFLKDDGKTSTVIPEHNNMKNMAAIVVNAGTPKGLELLNKANTNLNKQKQVAVNKQNGSKVVPINNTFLTNTTNSTLPTEITPSSKYIKLDVSTEEPQRTASPSTTGKVITYTPLTPSPINGTPPDISVDRLRANTLTTEKEQVLQASTPISREGQKGGNLMSMLSKVAYQYGPAATLLLMANTIARGSKQRKTRRRA
jgi:thiol-disulfide isomerase/thioredoxin